MIVFDEQLLGRGIEAAVARWYPGAVCFITDLRPETVIKDESVPVLLSQASQPTFVTINEADFWKRVEITNRFCVVCLALPDSKASEASAMLLRLLRHSHYRTKSQRMGRVVRITEAGAAYYTAADRTVHSIEDW